MTTESNEDPYSPNVMKKLRESWMRVQTPAATQLFWERMLDNRDRIGLGGDLEEAYRQYFGPIRMWMHLRGVSQPRSIIEVAFGLNLLSETDKNWLLREIGEDEQIVQDAVDSAVLSKKLVLVERQRHAYWRGDRIQVDWNKYSTLWTFLWELARQATQNGVLDRLLLGEDLNKDYISKTRHRLTKLRDFPESLSHEIVSAGRGSIRLDLSPDQIELFEVATIEMLREVIG